MIAPRTFQSVSKRNEITFTYLNTNAQVVDGTSVLWAILDKVDPSLAVNIESLRAIIKTIKLHTYKNNFDWLLQAIKDNYQKILDSGSTCESILQYTINTLLSGPFQDFNMFMEGIRCDKELISANTST